MLASLCVRGCRRTEIWANSLVFILKAAQQHEDERGRNNWTGTCPSFFVIVLLLGFQNVLKSPSEHVNMRLRHHRTAMVHNGNSLSCLLQTAHLRHRFKVLIILLIQVQNVIQFERAVLKLLHTCHFCASKILGLPSLQMSAELSD